MRWKPGSLYGVKKMRNKEETNRNDLTGWGHTVDQVWREEAQRWPEVLGSAGEMRCVSGQAGHLQEHESYPSFAVAASGQEQLHPGPRKLNQPQKTNSV